MHALEARYARARTLKASFFERYSDGKGAVQSETGTVYFSRPGRMRWDYESPERKLFLVDGTNVWFYVPADRTVSRAKMKESSDWRTPLALLVGKADLSRLCRTIEIVEPAAAGGRGEGQPTEPGRTVLRCTPRNGSGESADATNPLREVLLETDPQARLVRVVLREAGNIETEFRFGNWEENIPIPEAQFHFQPPSGVAVVDEADLAGAIHNF
jgi:outer membrane lipoprotein carrier protein